MEADCARIKHCHGYFLKQNRGQTLDVMKHTSCAVIEHLFNNHFYCDKWCKRQRRLDKGLPLEGSGDNKDKAYYRCKIKDNDLY
eukprot:6349025-Ditylum_brightwellii.AAC.1